MKSTEFKAWMKSIERMSRNQRDKLRKRLEGKENTDEVIALIEHNQDDKPACPHYKASNLYRWGKVSELQRYRCRQCNRTFNALSGTPLARLRYKNKWFEYEQTMIQGLSIRKSADSCGIAKNTSFKWRHRFLQIPATDQPGKMNGIVEADETYFLESFKGQRRLSRSARKHGGIAVYLRSYLGWHRMIDRLGQNITPALCFLPSLGKTRQFQQLNVT
ncbi:hypothetical protein [Nitrosomonas sp. Nm166]|uniref:IS1/IS1595 family N-terminal zinc-binding domain-containing protein n=1 Tax=Nitrosomonas sp. Nm166 TaxID=1881054 RepID=UPI0008E1BFCB|nr:hypothetical protein [Nitrosomonas sp. Nm166]SFE98249.1 Transposase [Nitrosomonas sp. Nm166]